MNGVAATAVTVEASPKCHLDDTVQFCTLSTREHEEQQQQQQRRSQSQRPPAPRLRINRNNNNNHESNKQYHDDNNNDHDDYDDEWELTWPIWHMLPWHERKALACSAGFDTIGEFEEYMTLQRAVDDSSVYNNSTIAYDNNLLYHHNHHNSSSSSNNNSLDESNVAAAPGAAVEQSHSPAVSVGSQFDYKEENEEEGVDSERKELQMTPEERHATEQQQHQEQLCTAELTRLGGPLLLLPDEMIHRVLEWLPIDAYAVAALVSPHWKRFTRTEAVYKLLCERIYMQPCYAKRILHVNRFGCSYRTMLDQRSRIRSGGGVYVLRYALVKPIQRDMWTEIPFGAVLETVYYRYLYFQEDGRVLYALTAAPPQEMFRRFQKICLLQQAHSKHELLHHHHHHNKNKNVAVDTLPPTNDPAAVWGMYRIQKQTLTVTARQPWQFVRLELSIVPRHAIYGRWGCLTLKTHVTNRSGNFDRWEADQIVHQVPAEEPFRFIRDARL